MVLEKVKKGEVIKSYQRHEKDTGSSSVQVALMTERINYLTEHFKAHPKDFHSRTGLLKLVGNRRRFLTYLKDNNPDIYKDLVGKLGIRK